MPPVPNATAVQRALLAELGEGPVVVDADVVDAYRADRATPVVPGTPAALVRARSTADVQATLRVASRLRVPVVPRGLGTGLSGGSSAIDGCIVLSTEQLRTIEIDPAAMVAVVGPGLRNEIHGTAPSGTAACCGKRDSRARVVALSATFSLGLSRILRHAAADVAESAS